MVSIDSHLGSDDFAVGFFDDRCLSGGQNSFGTSSGHLRSRSRATSIGSSCGLSTRLILAVFVVNSTTR